MPQIDGRPWISLILEARTGIVVDPAIEMRVAPATTPGSVRGERWLSHWLADWFEDDQVVKCFDEFVKILSHPVRVVEDGWRIEAHDVIARVDIGAND